MVHIATTALSRRRYVQKPLRFKGGGTYSNNCALNVVADADVLTGTVETKLLQCLGTTP